MAQYVLAAGQFTASTLPAQVGKNYHLGFGDGTHFYGYMLMPTRGAYNKKADLLAKQQLTQYASPNITDRDFVTMPRVSQGSWAGGWLQVVGLDLTKFYDSNLEVSIPGRLQLRTKAVTRSYTPAAAQAINIVPWANDFYLTFAELTGTIYRLIAGTSFNAVTANARVTALDSDGYYLYYAFGGNIYRRRDDNSETQVTTTVNNTLNQMWVVEQGTNGYFVYYNGGTLTNQLWKVDISNPAALPLGAASQPQVPTGGMSFPIVDVVAYQTGIAIATTQSGLTTNAGPSDVWFHDGQNMTRIAQIPGIIQGMCNANGNLYISTNDPGVGSSPVQFAMQASLIQLSAGSFTRVATASLPGGSISTQAKGLRPAAANGKVYWPIQNAATTGISSADYIIVYDPYLNSVTHLPNATSNDFQALSQASGSFRRVAVSGDIVAGVQSASATAGTGYYFAGLNAANPYAASGRLISSAIDFTTPAIVKAFQSVYAVHTPLPANTSVRIDCFVDKDPALWTSSLTADFTSGTNSTLNSTLTTAQASTQVVGKTIYYVLTLSTSDGANTPIIKSVSAQIGVPYAWDLLLACVNKRTMLGSQQDDTQGVTGKDLAYLFFNTWENGNLMTMTDRNGTTYTVSLESFEGINPSPQATTESGIPVDEEYELRVTLRQAA